MNASPTTVEPTQPRPHLITATWAAELVRDALSAGRPDLAVRRLTEAVARLIESRGLDIPGDVLAEPGHTGDSKYDAVHATAFLYAANLCQIDAPAWTKVAPLERSWLWGGDGHESEEYIEFIRNRTPAEFLERNILCRARDWVNA